MAFTSFHVEIFWANKDGWMEKKKEKETTTFN